MWGALIKALSDNARRKTRQKKADDKALAQGPSWRHRRRLIHISFVLAVAMILFGAATVFMDSTVGVEMIIGGVALLSIIVTAYTTSATYEDVRLWNDTPRIRFGEGRGQPMHKEFDTDNPDGL